MEVRRKAISIVLSMTSSRNVEEVAIFLKKQLQKTQEQDMDKVGIGKPIEQAKFLSANAGTRV
jgi:vesicle coat complex subunit